MNPPLSSLKEFFKKLADHDNDRFRSFEHCYRYFNILKGNLTDETLDKAMLHLGFYLASWGMYRGSSFLLQKDYKIYEPIIRKLLEKKFLKLRNLDKLLNSNNIHNLSELTFSLHGEIQEILELERTAYIEYMEKDLPKERVSSTLTTKVMMGTLGCIPAYDRFYKTGIKIYCQNNHKKLLQNFSENSIRAIYGFMLEIKDELVTLQTQIAVMTGFKCPLMKLIDSYFWLIGYDEEEKKKKSI